MTDVRVTLPDTTGIPKPSYRVRFAPKYRPDTPVEYVGLLSLGDAARCAARNKGIVMEQTTGLLLLDFRPHKCPQCKGFRTWGQIAAGEDGHLAPGDGLLYRCTECDNTWRMSLVEADGGTTSAPAEAPSSAQVPPEPAEPPTTPTSDPAPPKTAPCAQSHHAGGVGWRMTSSSPTWRAPCWWGRSCSRSPSRGVSTGANQGGSPNGWCAVGYPECMVQRLPRRATW